LDPLLGLFSLEPILACFQLPTSGCKPSLKSFEKEKKVHISKKSIFFYKTIKKGGFDKILLIFLKVDLKIV
jgi:hypothetical protein